VTKRKNVSTQQFRRHKVCRLRRSARSRGAPRLPRTCSGPARLLRRVAGSPRSDIVAFFSGSLSSFFFQRVALYLTTPALTSHWLRARARRANCSASPALGSLARVRARTFYPVLTRRATMHQPKSASAPAASDPAAASVLPRPSSGMSTEAAPSSAEPSPHGAQAVLELVRAQAAPPPPPPPPPPLPPMAPPTDPRALPAHGLERAPSKKPATERALTQSGAAPSAGTVARFRKPRGRPPSGFYWLVLARSVPRFITQPH